MGNRPLRDGFVVRMWLAVPILILCLSLGFGACGAPPTAKTNQNVIVTTMPVLGLIISPIAETYEVEVLLKNGQSPHGFQISPSKAKTLSTMNLLVYAHPEIDGWATDLADNNAISLWGESELEEELDHEEESEHHSSAHDAHYWTDPVAVLEAIQRFSDVLCERQPDQCVAFRRNANAFSVRINDVQTQIKSKLELLEEPCFVVAQPFMTQFLDRFGVPTVGPLQPLPGHDASPKSLGNRIGQAKTAGCNVLLVQAAVDNQAMIALAKDMEVEIVEVDPLGAKAATYEEYLMRLAEALFKRGSSGGSP